ncbi:S8 family serine peptidase, partial [bacterium]|nr:S8 family serine peptidase [bacterium]
MLLTVCVLLASNSLFGREYSLMTDERTTSFELNTSMIAVGFDQSLTESDRSNLIKTQDWFDAFYVERDIPTLQATVLRMKSGSRVADAENAIQAMEKLPEILWAAPVLMYDDCEHIPGPLLYVQFVKEISSTTAETLLKQNGFAIEKACDWADGMYHVRRENLSGLAVLETCNRLSQTPEIVWAEPDWIRTVKAHTNDSYYSNQWYLNNTGGYPYYGTPDADMDMPEAWTYTTGSSSIVISICDVGVDIDHPDLDGHIETGYDAVDADSDPNPETTNDGHGTCCAGIASAETNNSLGIAGVGYDCHIMGTKMGYIISGNSIQTYDSWIINCITYSRDNADVMSNSWGGGYSDPVSTAFNNAQAAGLTILVSSGNGNSAVQWPATLSSVIAVGATNQDDDRCDPDDWGGGQGSNYGSELDVVAPGNDQYATDLVGTWGYNTSSSPNGDYYSNFGGTSGACPAAAGVAALILSVDPSLTPTDVESILEATADDEVGDPLEDENGYDVYMGWGRVNANSAVRYVYSAPSNLVATDNQPTVPLDWDAPWRNPIRYDIYRSTTGQYGTYTLLDNTMSTFYDDEDVVHLQTYWYKIKAVFLNGESEYSNADSGTPFINFMPPQNLDATGGLDGHVPLSWTVPASGTPDEYDVYRSTTGEFGSYSFLITVEPTAHDDYDVVNGNEYWYKVKAIYSSPTGESDFSNADGAMPLAPVNNPPEISHDPMHDIETGSGTMTAISSDPDAGGSILDVKLFYRLAGGGDFDSMTFGTTGYDDEFAGDLSGFAAGSYEYYLRTRDNSGLAVYVPETAPAELYGFDVGEFCGNALGYDDGSAEYFNYAIGDQAENMKWAVKFTPTDFPFVLCGV